MLRVPFGKTNLSLVSLTWTSLPAAWIGPVAESGNVVAVGDVSTITTCSVPEAADAGRLTPTTETAAEPSTSTGHRRLVMIDLPCGFLRTCGRDGPPE